MKILNSSLMGTILGIQSTFPAFAGAVDFNQEMNIESYGCRNECSGSCEYSCYGACETSCSGGCEGTFGYD